MTDHLTVDTITSNQLDALQLRAARMEHAVAEHAKLSVQLEDAERERDEHKQNYLGACTTIAAMHAAAVGRNDEGPIRGVVEDVEDVRLRAEQAEAEVKRLSLMVDEYATGAGALTDKLKRVRDLRDRWTQAGPPPLGVSLARWVDARLIELNIALDGGPAGSEEQDEDAAPVVVPAAERAAVLTEAADAVFALDYDEMVSEEEYEDLGSMREAWDLGTIHAYQLLRRMAAEPNKHCLATLSDSERKMLTYALDQAQEHIWSRDGFTDDDQAAVTSLRRMTDEAQQDTAQP